jgi:superfamily II DNA/RNA helicase
MDSQLDDANAAVPNANSERRHLTRDVVSNQTARNGTPVQFSDMMLSKQVLKGLDDMGITHPSPVQLSVIPVARFGADVVAHAKAGTGKTVVFAVVLLECVCAAALSETSKGAQSTSVIGLVVAPTRELVSQINHVITRMGAFVPNLRCVACVGGLPLRENVDALAQGAQIVVGTPGRLRQLMEKRVLDTSSLDVVVLDEADKLLQDEFWGVSSFILEALPEHKQLLAVSATMSPQARERIELFGRDLQVIAADGMAGLDDDDDGFVEPDEHVNNKREGPGVGNDDSNNLGVSEEVTGVSGGARADLAWTVLLGVEHYIVQVDSQQGVSPTRPVQSLFDLKAAALLDILQTVSFQQCIVFCNQRSRAGSIVESLTEIGLPADLIAGDLPQTQRNAVMDRMRAQSIKVLV